MKNELGRKITSLTLMAIMLAGGLSFAVPGAIPTAAAANANLFVSAENSEFSNYMSGPQIIEVVVIDSSISDTDQGKGEPDVTVNGKDLRMVQNTDGNWYGYFADRTMTQIADATGHPAGSPGIGLDYGAFCDQGSAATLLGITGSLSDTVGVIVKDSTDDVSGNPSPTGAPITNTCTGVTVSGTMSVLREVKTPNTVTPGNAQGITPAVWPFVQLYSLNPTGNVIVQYNKGGNVQSTTLTFDDVEKFASLSADRAKYTRNAQVHVTVTDTWLNIDPTDEDSWTFAANKASTLYGTYYQLFNENGGPVSDGAAASGFQLTIPELKSLMCEDNCQMTLNPDVNKKGFVVTLQDNDDSALTVGSSEDPTTAATDGGTLTAGTATTAALPITITELGPKSGIFGTYDESDTSAIRITSTAQRGTSASLSYVSTDPATILVGFDFATIDIKPTDQEWNSGEEIPVVLVDGDANLNSRADEDLDLNNPNVALIPALSTGDPFTLGEGTVAATATFFDTTATAVTKIIPANATSALNATITVQKFSDRAMIGISSANSTNGLLIDIGTNAKDLRNSIKNPISSASNFRGLNLLNYDIRSLTQVTGPVEIGLAYAPTALINTNGSYNAFTYVSLANVTSLQGLVSLNETSAEVDDPTVLLNKLFDTTTIPDSSKVGIVYRFADVVIDSTVQATSPIVTDLFTFGMVDDGQSDVERIANQIIRLELEESGDNTSTFEGTLEYKMINQLNILDAPLYKNIDPIGDLATFVVLDDLDTEAAPRVNYNDLGADGVTTQVADQQDAGTHSGIVSLNADSFKVADTVTVALEDVDLNVDSDLIDIYTVVTTSTDSAFDAVGEAGLPIVTKTGTLFSFGALGRLLDITFDDERWADGTSTGDSACGNNSSLFNKGLGDTAFTLIETGPETGKFTGDFQIPNLYCARTGANAGTYQSVTGTDIEVNYLDFRDASGEIVEVGDSAGVRANTGSVSFDRTVYPVPFGILDDVPGLSAKLAPTSTPNGHSLFPIHATGITGVIDSTSEILNKGDLLLHVRVNDPDFDTSASGEDKIATSDSNGNGPVKVTVSRGSSKMVLAYAGATESRDGTIDIGDNSPATARELGPITEIAPDAGIFEFDLPVRYTDGPASSLCPVTTSFIATNGTVGRNSSELSRFDTLSSASVPGSNGYCILQGDIITVEYTDPTDASGDPNTVTDSATFDLRNGVLQSDKSVYIIGGDMILTLIEPDFDLDNDSAETYDLDLIEWDSDAGTVTMGSQGGSLTSNGGIFDPEPTDFRETGDSTGIYQIVIEIPSAIGNDRLERGEEIVLEYTDWGPSGSDYVGQEDEDVNLTIFTSNFGATVELDQKVYTWTDKVYITIVAPDHNFDSKLIDEIGDTAKDPIKVSTRGHKLDNYKLVETGTDTGIFTGEVILVGFKHDADGDTTTGDANGNDVGGTTTSTGSTGPTDGFLESDDDDGITVSFEFSEDETIVGSALIRWNIGEVQWLEASYPASGTGVVRVIDPDMNLNPEAVDNFDVDVWSDSDAGGIDLTVTETNEATGIFEGTVFFTTTDESSGHRLRVAEGDTITADYQDNTLPNPYTRADELDIEATSLIGTIVPPLERAPASNLRVVDPFGNSLSKVSVDQQVQITADLANGQDREQAFAYLVQIQDSNGVTVSLAWITGSLSSGQSFSPALSWTPAAAGTYTATAFVWESVDNPTALSPPVETTITVS